MADANDTEAVVVALADVLTRRCVGTARRADERLARRLLAALHAAGPSTMVLAAAAGGVAAAFPQTEQALDEDAWRAGVAAARAPPAHDAPVSEVVLAAAALGLMAAMRSPTSQASDLVRCAAWARHAERHELAAQLAREALRRGES